MIKKKIKTTSKVTASKPVEVFTEKITTSCDKVCKIDKIDVDFGRGDLNLMRDKINEIIENGN